MAVKMVIEVSDDGAVRVDGFPNNQMIAYGLLEVARDTMATFFREQAAAKIKPPTQADILAIRRVQ